MIYQGLFKSNASVSGIACDGYLCVKMGACDHTHKWTARAMSAAPICYVAETMHTDNKI